MLRSYNALSGQGAHQATMPDLPPDKVLVPKEGKLIKVFLQLELLFCHAIYKYGFPWLKIERD